MSALGLIAIDRKIGLRKEKRRHRVSGSWWKQSQAAAGAPVSLHVASMDAGTHESSSPTSGLDPAGFNPAAQHSPDTGVETPRATMPPSARSSAVPRGNAKDGFGPSSCHRSDSGVDMELSTRVLVGSQGG